mmetsp:Transcript_9896/g.26097  ORF Transcript_9896/g.26097 Transcript_9896/m.26097 type:complete len:245 (-) Transcript_9896:320-1054(-)
MGVLPPPPPASGTRNAVLHKPLLRRRLILHDRPRPELRDCRRHVHDAQQLDLTRVHLHLFLVLAVRGEASQLLQHARVILDEPLLPLLLRPGERPLGVEPLGQQAASSLVLAMLPILAPSAPSRQALRLPQGVPRAAEPAPLLPGVAAHVVEATALGVEHPPIVNDGHDRLQVAARAHAQRVVRARRELLLALQRRPLHRCRHALLSPEAALLVVSARPLQRMALPLLALHLRDCFRGAATLLG